MDKQIKEGLEKEIIKHKYYLLGKFISYIISSIVFHLLLYYLINLTKPTIDN